MGCFMVPMTEAVVTTIATHVVKKKEARNEEVSSAAVGQTEAPAVHIPLSGKLGWLNKMLWGGSALLAFEHMWHGEITPWYPFLTAAANAEDMAAMLQEMSTVGVAMAAVVTAVWLGMVAVSARMEKKERREEPGARETEESIS